LTVPPSLRTRLTIGSMRSSPYVPSTRSYLALPPRSRIDFNGVLGETSCGQLESASCEKRKDRVRAGQLLNYSSLGNQFYRDSRRNEVDLLIREGATLAPIEI
jgi:hypothetical protein